ncbi:FMN-binding protein [Asanoa sp. NPDC049573]|uniref:FMN-binding protein n=1 Tax=Asanoa sp. NPDC049573 TaxID=3155396 RepID=UPI0034200B48
MRRAVLAVAGLAAGTSLLVVVKGGGAGAAPDTVAAANAGPTPSAGAGSPDPSAPPAKKPVATPTATKKTTKPKAGKGTTAAAPPPAQPRSNKVVGPRVENPYGAVQVVIELSGTRIVDVRTLEMPDLEARSDQLSSLAEPRLRDEAIREQGANLDTVSGATETSESYKESLRVAIERMKKGERD